MHPYIACPKNLQEFSCQELVPSNSSILPEQSETNGVGLKGTIDCFSPSEENQHHVPQKIEADKWFHEMVPMEHRLLSAIVMEEDISEPNVVQRDILFEFSNSHVPCAASRFLGNELQASAISSNFGLSVDFMNSNNSSVVHQSLSNGFTSSSSFISSSSQSSVHNDNLSDEVNFVYPENGPFDNLIPQTSSLRQKPGKNFSSSPHEYQYGQMSVNDKIFIELQSIGIFPEAVVWLLKTLHFWGKYLHRNTSVLLSAVLLSLYAKISGNLLKFKSSNFVIDKILVMYGVSGLMVIIVFLFL